MPARADRPLQAQVVLLSGPSGCGKTHLATSLGLPVVALDDFYRDGTHPGLPRTPDGTVDWEDPRTWDGDAAAAALDELCRSERATMPVYAFGEDRAVDEQVVERCGAPIVVAEGIFAAELTEPLRRRGLLADSLLVHQNRWVTFVRRLVRDLREGRKRPGYLVRQGWTKTRCEPAVVARQRAAGARRVTKPEARELIDRLLAEAAAVSGDVVGPAGIEPATKAL